MLIVFLFILKDPSKKKLRDWSEGTDRGRAAAEYGAN